MTLDPKIAQPQKIKNVNPLKLILHMQILDLQNKKLKYLT